jgi:hypothetical protein
MNKTTRPIKKINPKNRDNIKNEIIMLAIMILDRIP